jgi:Domain of unknown function (DUF6532)
MYDTLSEYRTQLVAKVRDLLPSHYGFSGYDDIRPLIVELLHDDNFTCPNLKDVSVETLSRLMAHNRQPSKKRFLADIIVNVIAILFFQNDKKGLGREAGTRHMFSPLRAETVILAATFIQHALEEYAAGGTKLINKMQTSVIRSMYDHIDTIVY